MSRSLASYTALAALTLTLAGGAVALPAYADTAPVAGTQACTDAVNGTSSVTAAKTALDSAKEQQQSLVNQLAAAKVVVPFVQADVDALTSKLNSQTVSVANAQRAYDRAVAAATKALCTGTATTTTPPTTDPTSPPVVSHTRTQGAIDNEVDALNCSSTNAALQTIDRQIEARHVAGQTTAEVNSRLKTKLDSLSCTGNSAVTQQAAAQTAKDCGCDTSTTTVTEAPATSNVITYKTVVPTQSDGSTATTSGTQVTDVPSGSASTGTA